MSSPNIDTSFALSIEDYSQRVLSLVTLLMRRVKRTQSEGYLTPATHSISDSAKLVIDKINHLKYSIYFILPVIILFYAVSYANAMVTVWGRVTYTDPKGNVIGLNNVQVHALATKTYCDPEDRSYCDSEKVDMIASTSHSYGSVGQAYAGWGKWYNIEAEGDGYYIFEQNITCGLPDWILAVSGAAPPGIPPNGIFTPQNKSLGPIMNLMDVRHDIQYTLPNSIISPAPSRPEVPFMSIQLGGK